LVGWVDAGNRPDFDLVTGVSAGTYAKAQIDGTDFNLAAIPSEFGVTREKSFEQKYMQALYDEGYRSGFQGYRWMKEPPGLGNKPNLTVPPDRKPSSVALSLPN
jgi:hypothetical protein